MKNILVFILLLCITSPAVGQRVKKSHEDIVFAAELMHQAYEEEAREILTLCCLSITTIAMPAYWSKLVDKIGAMY